MSFTTGIKQGKTCRNKGGLVMYLSKTFNYKVILSLNQYDNWEGQFIIVNGGGFSKDIIIGNIYRPPRDLNENYKQFLSEFTPIISSFDRTNSDIIIAGDFNINLLKINENIMIMLYNTLILSHLNYVLTALGYRCDRIKNYKKKAVRIICLSKYNAHTTVQKS